MAYADSDVLPPDVAAVHRHARGNGRDPLAILRRAVDRPKFESVDPLKDALAELKRIRTGTLTLSEAIAQNGYDPEKQLRCRLG